MSAIGDPATTHPSLRAYLKAWVDTPFFPEGVLGYPEDSLLDRFYLTEFSIEDVDPDTVISIGVAWEVGDEPVLPMLNVGGISALLGSEGLASLALALTLREDGFSLAASAAATLRFSDGLIRPVALVDGVFEVREDEIYEVRFGEVTTVVDHAGNIAFGGVEGVGFDPFAIGETGVVFDPGDVILSFGVEAAERLAGEYPEAGLTGTFRGVFIPASTAYFPEDFPLESAALENAFIGTSGFSGSLKATAGDPGVVERGDFAGFPFALTSVALTFVQNSVTECAVEGALTLPFFDQPIGVLLSLGVDGSLGLAVRDAAGDGLATVEVDQLGTVTLASLGVDTGPEGSWLVLSGSVQLEVGAPALEWPLIEIQELRLGPGGEVEIPDGWIDLQQPLAMNLYGFRLEISRVGFGNQDDGRRWMGFSGGLHLIDALPAGASVEGLRVIWDPAGATDSQLKLDGAGVELTVPGLLALGGSVALFDEDPQRTFRGALSLELTPLGITLDAAAMIGHDSALDYNFAYLYLSLELPIGLPLWATGTALYGLSGLYGINVAPTATDGDWYGWYKASPEFNVIDPGKWAGEPDGKAFGAGMVLGTLFDAGWVVSTKSLLAVTSPGPVLLIQGKADLMKLPPGLLDAGESAFNALAVLDGEAGSFQLDIDAGWDLERIIDVGASAQAYFDFGNPANWHLYLGQDEPEDRRIRASVITLFDADAYLMIEPDGIDAGFAVRWGDSWTFGRVKVTLTAWIEAGATLTWSPPQLEGSLSMGGELGVKVALFEVSIAAEATLSAESPRPFRVRGELDIRVDLPSPLKDLNESVLLEWRQEQPPDLEDPYVNTALEHLKVSETWQVHLAPTGVGPTDPPDPLFVPGPVVPLDARPAVTFDRSVHDLSGLGNVSGADYPGGVGNGDYTFDYQVTRIGLEAWPKAGSGGWVPVPDTELWGTWAATVDGDGEVAASKLQLWTKTPFSFTRRTSRAYRDAFLARFPAWPCPQATPPETIRVDWFDQPAGRQYGYIFEDQSLTFIADTVAEVQQTAEETACRGAGESALFFRYDLWVLFPEPARRAELCVEGEILAIKAYSGGQLIEEIPDPRGIVLLTGPSIEWFQIVAPEQGSWLVKIRYITEAQAAADDWDQQRMDRIKASETWWSSHEPILAPETHYRLTVETRIARTGPGVDAERLETHYAYFQTAAPPALDDSLQQPAPTPADGAIEVEAYPRGPLWADLGIYLDRTIPADGQVAVYRAYDLGAEFNEDYVEQMYGADMLIRLLDTNDRPVLDSNGHEVMFQNVWEDLPSAELSETEIPYRERMVDCTEAPDLHYAPNRRLVAGHGVLLLEDFSGDLEAWTDPSQADGDASANWAISGGMLELIHPIGTPLGNLLIAGEPDWGDCALEVALSEDGDEVGLVFRYSAGLDASYYRLRMNADGRMLERCVGRAAEVLWQDQVAYSPGIAAVLGVQCQGPRLRGQLDAELLFDVLDEGGYSSGRVGLYSLATAAFGQVLVRRWPNGLLRPQTGYRAELLASYVLFEAPSWPISPATEGWLSMTSAAGDKEFAIIGQEGGADYRVEASFTLETASRAGLMARFQLDAGAGTFACYRLFINPGERKLRLAYLEGGYDAGTGVYSITTRDAFWECRDPACGIDFDLTQHDAALTCQGQELTIEVDGQVVASVQDPRLTRGQFGIYRGGDDVPVFSSVVVRSRPRRPIYRWSFTTSAYPGLVEHLDSHNAEVYDHVAAGHGEESGIDPAAFQGLVSEASAEMSAAIEGLAERRFDLEAAGSEAIRQSRAALVAAVDVLNETAGRHYQALDSFLLGGAYRPHPPVVELTAIEVDGRRALLLELPEPLDWTRVGVRLRRWVGGSFRDVAPDLLGVWNRDGTRALLALAGGVTLLASVYELQISLRLETAEGPVRRRSGSTLPEVGALKFELV